MLIVGRGRGADIRLDDGSVSRLHLELVIGGGGEVHLADRSSENGTWMWTEGAWQRVTARAAVPEDRLRLGAHEVTVAELIRRAPEPPRQDPGADPNRMDDGLPVGPVRRDPETGAVIAGRLR